MKGVQAFFRHVSYYTLLSTAGSAKTREELHPLTFPSKLNFFFIHYPRNNIHRHYVLYCSVLYEFRVTHENGPRVTVGLGPAHVCGTVGWAPRTSVPPPPKKKARHILHTIAGENVDAVFS